MHRFRTNIVARLQVKTDQLFEKIRSFIESFANFLHYIKVGQCTHHSIRGRFLALAGTIAGVFNLNFVLQVVQMILNLQNTNRKKNKIYVEIVILL